MHVNPDRKRLALFGSLGAIAPDVVILYSKIHTTPSLTFVTWQYIAVTSLYLGLAAFVAIIYPYGKRPTEAKAFGVGVALPTAISLITSFLHGRNIAPRGGTISGSILDLMSLF